jgi:transmembrane sensor
MNEDVTLAKWLSDEMDDRELKDFMSTPEYATYSKIKEFSGRLSVPETDMAALYKIISDKKNKANQSRVRRLNPWIARVAAILVLALGATFFLYATHTTTQRAEIAGRETFLLPDNSEVVLNAASKATYREFNWSGSLF